MRDLNLPGNLSPLQRASAPEFASEVPHHAFPISYRLLAIGYFTRVWLLAAALLACGVSLHAQSGPTITVQPASRTNLPGTAVTFTVAVSDAGPFTYQWQFNGTNLPNTLISTVAGNTNWGYSGDGGPATNASLDAPTGLAVDAFGNLFISDNGVGRVRMVNTNGLITTVAGNGSEGYPGDGGPATNASLYAVWGVATDASGNVYIADCGYTYIRKVDANGIISTVAGNGNQGYSGDGGAATNASLCYPHEVAVDTSGNLYIADTGNNRIRKVNRNGIITTVAGNGTQGYSGDGGPATSAGLFIPYGVAVDGSGNLYIADTDNNCIRKVGANGIISMVAGGFSYPTGVAVDASGNLYVADMLNNCVFMANTNGLVTAVAGNGTGDYSGDGGPAKDASLHWPTDVALDSLGNLLIADQWNGRVREVHFSGYPSWSLNNVSISDAGDYRVVIANRYGSVTSQVATLTVALLPTVTAQPGSQTVLAGTSPSFSVAAAGSEPLSYTWLFAGTNLLQTGPSSLLALADVSSGNSGDYFVVVTNAYGSVTSQVATLTVVPTFITVQPSSQCVVIGGSPDFSVAVAGGLGPFWYLWYFGETNLLQGGTNSTLTLFNISPANAGNYTVVITNTFASVTSQVAVLTVGFPPTVSVQPAGQTNLPGTSPSFSVTAGGTGPFSYQWRFNGTNLPGIMTTVAGSGARGFSGDAGLATNAALYWPSTVAVDASGRIYVADQENSRIRQVDTNGLISTLAGNGSLSYSGDGGAATNAGLWGAYGVALDPFGNLFIADTGNERVRKVDTNGVITTVVGNGGAAYSGDGGAATNATLFRPQGVTLDQFCNLYVVDQFNQRVRKVDANSLITTVAGNGSPGYAGDGGPATNALLYYPNSVAVDDRGCLYIADGNNHRVRRVDTNGIITTFAGNGTATYSGDGGAATSAGVWGPDGLVFDGSGNLYVSQQGDHRIRKVDTNGIITTFAGNGTGAYFGDGALAINASLYKPAGLACDRSGNLYIADVSNERIRKVSFEFPFLPFTNITVTNAGDYTVVISSPYGSITSAVAILTVAAPPVINSQPASQIAFVGTSPSFSVGVLGSGPFSYAWYFAGTNLLQSGPNSGFTLLNAFLTNGGSYTVVVTNNYGSVTSQIATLTVAFPPTVTVQPTTHTNLLGTVATLSVAIDGTGPFAYQWQFNGTNLPSNQIATVAGNGSLGSSGDGGAATNANLYFPCGVALDLSGNLFIADTDNSRIRRVDPSGVISAFAGNGVRSFSGDGGAATSSALNFPGGLFADTGGNLCIADTSNQRVRKVGINGIIATIAGNGSAGYYGDGGAATSARLYYPSGVASDAYGNLYIADTSNNRIRKVGVNGVIITVAGNGSASFSGDCGAATNAGLNQPWGVALDGWGNLYIADTGNNRIRKVATNGIIASIAGIGTASYSGDGGMATNASLRSPYCVAADASGNIYLADKTNRVRMIDADGFISTIAGNGTNGYSGDGGAPTNAKISVPYGMALDIAGDLFIADTGNNRIRKVSLSGARRNFVIGQMAPASTGDYSVIITSPYGSVTSQVATLSVAFPPVVTTQPASQFAVFGSRPSFSVSATGSGPFGYWWYFNGTNLLQSGTNTTLTLPNVSFADAGNYTVVVTNSYTSVTSRVATLTVGFPPSVTTQPSSLTNMAGTPAFLNVAPGGTGPFNYQWRLNGTNLPNNLISTVAGNGSAGFAGDGGPATNASLYGPIGVAPDAYGAVYIGDWNNNRVRRVDTNGFITTVAGNGTAGYSGDGGAATNAGLRRPSGVAFDSFGNLYVADEQNGRVRKVDTSGAIATAVAGLVTPCAVAFDAFGSMYIADRAYNVVFRVDASGSRSSVAGNGDQRFSGDGGAATNAGLSYPGAVCFDAVGNLYIADGNHQRVRMVNPAGIITTVAGGGASSGDGGAATNAYLSYPQGVAVDAFGNLYIADDYRSVIRKVDTNGIITTVAGGGLSLGDGGPATNASLGGPVRVALDPAGNLFIGDMNGHRIRKVALGGNPFLSLSRAGFADAGDYTVVISSPYGSVTSQVATLTVTMPPPPQLSTSDTNFGFLSNQFGFNVSGVAGQSIVLEASTNLVDWLSLFTNTTDGIIPIYFLDPASTNFPWRFYRARSP